MSFLSLIGKSWYYFNYVYRNFHKYDFIIKGDDDALINPHNLNKKLLSLQKHSTYYGKIVHMFKISFAYGYLYGLSWDLAEHISTNSTPRYGAEDIMIAKILSSKAEHLYSEIVTFKDATNSDETFDKTYY